MTGDIYQITSDDMLLEWHRGFAAGVASQALEQRGELETRMREMDRRSRPSPSLRDLGTIGGEVGHPDRHR